MALLPRILLFLAWLGTPIVSGLLCNGVGRWYRPSTSVNWTVPPLRSGNRFRVLSWRDDENGTGVPHPCNRTGVLPPWNGTGVLHPGVDRAQKARRLRFTRTNSDPGPGAGNRTHENRTNASVIVLNSEFFVV